LRAVVVLWVILSTCLFAQSSVPKAVDLARQGRYAEAREALAGVAEPAALNQRIALHRLNAAIASGLHEPKTAVGEMRAALALAPADPKLLLALAVAELQAGQADDALSHAEASPESATREALIGDIQEKRGDYLLAAKAYHAAIALAPDREQYRLALGLELIEHQSFQQAIAILERSAAAFPKSARIRTLLGIAQYAEGYSDDAMRSLEAAITVDPKIEAPYRALAKIVLQSSAPPPQRTIDALCSWNEFVCSALEFRVARGNGDSALEAKAITTLKRAPAQSAIAHCELGRAYESTAGLAKARTEMEACVRLDPSPQNHYRLGLLYKKLGLTDLAGKEMEQRKQILRKMSEETALGLNALQGLDLSAK
jgi:tetratricopeptide (TPR) repeat protein